MPNPTPGRIENDSALILQAGRLIAEFSFWPLGWVLPSTASRRWARWKKSRKRG